MNQAIPLLPNVAYSTALWNGSLRVIHWICLTGFP